MKLTDPRGRFAAYASHLGAYMHRWILRLPWFNIRLHHILQSDEGRDFHDHPFNFTSIILKGGYIEHRPGCACRAWAWNLNPCRRYTAPAIVRRKATDFHRLELIDGAAAWTLVFASPYFREWGFLLPGGQWVDYREYHRSYYGDVPEAMNSGGAHG